MGGRAPTRLPDAPTQAEASAARLWQQRGAPGAPLRLMLQQIHLVWRLLGIVWIGMLVAVIIVSLVPIYTALIADVQIQDILTAHGPIETNITTQVTFSAASPSVVAHIDQLEGKLSRQYLSSFAPTSTEYLQGSNLAFVAVNDHPPSDTAYSQLLGSLGQPLAYDYAQTAPHMRLLDGRLPQPSAPGQPLDVLVTPDIGLHVGDRVAMQAEGANTSVLLRVCGVWQPKDENDPYWDGRLFKTVLLQGQPGLPPVFPILTTRQNFFRLTNSFAPAYNFTAWYPHFVDPERLNVQNLAQQMAQLKRYISAVSAQILGTALYSESGTLLNGNGAVQQASTQTRLPALVQSVSTQLALIAQPLYIVAAQVAGLALLFITVIAGLLVEQQSELLATLRSRGASTLQLVLAFLAQGLIPAVLAALLGPICAAGLALLLIHLVETVARTVSVRYLIASASPALATTPALIGAALCVLALVLAAARAMRLDVLAFRREQGRSTAVPFWKRYYLDVALAGICAAGYLELSLFGGFGARTLLGQQTDPLLLAAPGLLLLAGGLLALRCFPLVAAASARLAAHARGAVALLAFAQVARVAGQFGRRALLLLLAVGLGIFALTFRATLTHNVADQAAYATGGDLRITLTTNVQSGKQAQQIAQTMAALPGAEALTPAYRADLTTTDQQGALSVSLLGVDPHTFASVAYWRSDYASASLGALMDGLRTHETSAAAMNASVNSTGEPPPLWAIISSSLAQALTLGPGDRLVLNVPQSAVSNIVILVGAVVNDFPTLYPGEGAGFIVVDAPTLYATLNSAQTYITYSPNEYWLRTTPSDADAQARARPLSAVSIASLVGPSTDRRALITHLLTDPLTSGMAGLLLLGAGLSAALAMLGSLVQAAVEARRRGTQFAILRTLGTSRGQLTRLLLAEQLVVYGFGLLGGVVLGFLLTTASLPFLAFSDARGDPTTAGVPPDILVVDPRLIGLFLAAVVLALLCALALEAGVAARLGLGTTLRLGEDY